MRLEDHREFDILLKSAAKAENAALPLDEWKAQILAQAASLPLEAEQEQKPSAKRRVPRAILPFTGVAAAVFLIAVLAINGGIGARSPAPKSQELPNERAMEFSIEGEPAPPQAAPAAIAESPEDQADQAEIAAPDALFDGGNKAIAENEKVTGFSAGASGGDMISQEERERVLDAVFAFTGVKRDAYFDEDSPTIALIEVVSAQAWTEHLEENPVFLSGEFYAVCLEPQNSPRAIYYVNPAELNVAGWRWEE